MSSENEVSVETKTSGRVKWFNNKSGYGFITAMDGDKAGEDVFVHHSALKTDEQLYKYLVLGEYVEFDWAEVSDKDAHQWQASNVTGVATESLCARLLRSNEQVMRAAIVDLDLEVGVVQDSVVTPIPLRTIMVRNGCLFQKRLKSKELYM